MEWRIVPGFPAYEASDDGFVRRCIAAKTRRAGTLLKPNGSARYIPIKLTRDGVEHVLLLHRVICETFHGPAPSTDHQAAHGDGNRRNNAASNLRWATAKENHQDRVAHGTSGHGEGNARAILTRADVDSIRARFDGTPSHIRQLANEYPVSVSAMRSVCRGRTWKTECARDAIDALLAKPLMKGVSV